MHYNSNLPHIQRRFFLLRMLHTLGLYPPQFRFSWFWAQLGFGHIAIAVDQPSLFRHSVKSSVTQEERLATSPNWVPPAARDTSEVARALLSHRKRWPQLVLEQ